LIEIAEPSADLREREQYGPPEPGPTLEQALNNTRLAMMRREAERLAIEQAQPAELPAVNEPQQPPVAAGHVAEMAFERVAWDAG
jgi:hypothetical protein